MPMSGLYGFISPITHYVRVCVAFRSGQKAVLCRTRLTPDEPMPTGVAGVGSGVQEQEKSMKVKRQELRFDKTEMSIHVRVYGK